ncbi:MAG TPA: formate dehydrogenase subunit delta [Steroidobacteraceae bacterium]|nr:formate dehydrogenase subunit delta [Steroidobacteraceae bacterium]
MNSERLVAMANDIAAFFDSEADKAVAAEGVRFHIARFWDPRMRREIVAHVGAGGAGLTPTARRAIELLAPEPTNSPNQSK